MRLDGCERPATAAAGGFRESARSKRRLAGTLRGQAAVTGEAPGAVDEHTDADALAFRVRELLDAPVLGRHELASPNDGARVGVFGTRSDRRIHRSCTHVAHGFRTLVAAGAARNPLAFGSHDDFAPASGCRRLGAGSG